jgi:hypothetical protein
MATFKDGQRVWLTQITTDLKRQGCKVGSIGIVHQISDTDGTDAYGVEFIRRGYKKSFQLVSLNTKLDGRPIPIVDLCKPLHWPLTVLSEWVDRLFL